MLLPVGPIHRAQPVGRHKAVGLVTLSTALHIPASFPPITGNFGKSDPKKTPFGDQCEAYFHTTKIHDLFIRDFWLLRVLGMRYMLFFVLVIVSKLRYNLPVDSNAFSA